jgi:Icc-related predicted phosphoesterase
MTRLLVISDLHLDQLPLWWWPESFPRFDVAVFAGDIDCSPDVAIRQLARVPALKKKPIIFVPGNHEFYHGDVEARLDAGRAAAAGTNVHMLDRDSVIIKGVRFIGAILWTDYNLFGDQITGQVAALQCINDHRYIKTGGVQWMPHHAHALHLLDRAFIETELAKRHAGSTVVVTHHAPHPGSLAPRYATEPASAGFVSNLESLILAVRPALWIHGHTHTSFDYRVGQTRILCNPKGYGPGRNHPRMENEAFDDQLICSATIKIGRARQTG